MLEKVFLRLLLVLFHGSIKDGLEIGRKGDIVTAAARRGVRRGCDSGSTGDTWLGGNTARSVCHEVWQRGRQITPAVIRLEPRGQSAVFLEQFI